MGRNRIDEDNDVEIVAVVIWSCEPMPWQELVRMGLAVDLKDLKEHWPQKT